MKAHKINAHALAKVLAEKNPEVDVDTWLADIRENPEMYFSDHVDVSDAEGLLPLSDVAWRRDCLSR